MWSPNILVHRRRSVKPSERSRMASSSQVATASSPSRTPLRLAEYGYMAANDCEEFECETDVFVVLDETGGPRRESQLVRVMVCVVTEGAMARCGDENIERFQSQKSVVEEEKMVSGHGNRGGDFKRRSGFVVGF